MDEESTIFEGKRLDEKALTEYGFLSEDGVYKYSKEIMDGDLRIEVSISSDGRVTGRAVDCLTDEEYVQMKIPEAEGSYVGAVRDEYQRLLTDIAAKCYIDTRFRSRKVIEDGLINKVLDIADNIPAGKVASYGKIAKLAGRPSNARLVGKIMSMADRFGEHPCHRVVNHAGRTVPGWKEQRELLEKEGVEFKKNGCVDMDRFSI